MFKILAPLSRLEEVDALASAGADELYFGVAKAGVDEGSALNLRPHAAANLRGVQEAAAAAGRLRALGKSAFLVLNNDFYPAPAMRAARALLDALAPRLDGVIVCDPLLMSRAARRHPRLKVVAGTRANVFNVRTALFYASLGARRFTLPRNLPWSDVVRIIDALPSHEFEVFVKNEDCPYFNGLCGYSHDRGCAPTGDEGAFCRVIERRGRFAAPGAGPRAAAAARARLSRRYALCANSSCAVCQLGPLLPVQERVGLKITGRMMPLGRKLRDLAFVRAGLRLLETGRPAADVRALQSRLYPEPCRGACYFSR